MLHNLSIPLSTVPQRWNIPLRILLGEPETGDVTGQQNSGVSSQVQLLLITNVCEIFRHL